MQNEEALSWTRASKIEKKASELEENSRNRVVNHALWVQARQEGRHPLSQTSEGRMYRPHSSLLRSNRSLSNSAPTARAFNAEITEFVPPPVHPDELKAWVAQRKFEKDSMTNRSREETYHQKALDADQQREMRRLRRMEYDEQRRNLLERNQTTVHIVRAKSAHARTARAYALQERQHAAFENTHRRIVEQEQAAIEAASSIQQLRQEEAMLLQRMQKAFEHETKMVEKFEKAAIGGSPLPIRMSPAGTGFFAGSDLLLLPTSGLAQTRKPTSVLGQDYLRTQKSLGRSTPSLFQTRNLVQSPMSPNQAFPTTPASVPSPFVPANTYRALNSSPRSFSHASPPATPAVNSNTPTSNRTGQQGAISPFKSPEPRGTFFTHSVNLSPAALQFSQTTSYTSPYRQERPVTSPATSRQATSESRFTPSTPLFDTNSVPGSPLSGSMQGNASMDAARDALLRSAKKNTPIGGFQSPFTSNAQHDGIRGLKGKSSPNAQMPLNTLLPNLFHSPGSAKR